MAKATATKAKFCAQNQSKGATVSGGAKRCMKYYAKKKSAYIEETYSVVPELWTP